MVYDEEDLVFGVRDVISPYVKSMYIFRNLIFLNNLKYIVG